MFSARTEPQFLIIWRQQSTQANISDSYMYTCVGSATAVTLVYIEYFKRGVAIFFLEGLKNAVYCPILREGTAKLFYHVGSHRAVRGICACGNHDRRYRSPSHSREVVQI